jgi:hypothetical protein
LQGSFPGIEIDVSGAGDHLDKLDTKTRRLKELMRSIVAGLPYKLKRDRVKDLVTYAVSRTNLKSTSALAMNVCPRVRFTGFKPDYQTEFGFSFGDYVEAYDPTSKSKSNDILTERTQPCIALYPSGNRNGSWVFWSLSTRSYIRRSQWKRLPVSQEVIDAMNTEAGDYKVVIADVADGGIEANDIYSEPEVEPTTTHVPKFVPELPCKDSEAQLTANEFNNTGVPELGYFDDDDMSESGVSEHGDQEQESDASNHHDLDQNLELLQQILEDSDSLFEPKDDTRVSLRRSQQENAGKRTYDNSYEWNLMNLSVGAAVQGFGDVAKDAVKEELTQLFIHKKALEPVRWDDLNQEQRKRAVRSHMFLKEKYEDGSFVKMKARLVADGRMQDRTVYTDYSSPTAKTISIMTCLKHAALKDWDMLKLDVGGAFLCAPINDEEVFMFLCEGMSGMCVQFMPEYEEYLRTDGRLMVKVNKAMYRLIQSAKLCYKELTRHLVKNGFKVCKTDEYVLVKKTAEGKYVVVLLYVDDILVLSGSAADRYEVKALLEDKYEKVTHTEGKRLPYLGMTIIKTAVGYEVTMSLYIDGTLKLHGKPVREYITPAKQDIFEACKTAPMLSEKAKFHSVVAKLLYLGKRGRPDILMPVQYLCMRVRNPTTDDENKLECVLGYLKLTKAWTRAFD